MPDKACSRCLERLPATAFRRIRDGGLDTYCRQCRRAYAMAWRKSHPTYGADYYRANQQKWTGYREGKKRGPCPVDGCPDLKHVYPRSGYVAARCKEHMRVYASDLYWRGRTRSERIPPDVLYRRSYLRVRGLTEEQYAALLESQSGQCAICHRSDQLLTVDHDHGCCDHKATGKRPHCGQCVRGLLCNNCNWAVGLLADDPARAQGVIDYLSR